MSDDSGIFSGVRCTPDGLYLDGFHVYSDSGRWIGVYGSMSRALWHLSELQSGDE